MDFEYTNPALISSIVAVVLLTIVAISIAMRQRVVQTKNLRERFGPEYDFVLRESESRRKGEARLLAREKRVQLLKLHELTPTQRAHYLAAWELVQSRFIDHPRGAVIEADELLTSLLQARGFPAERFEQRAADLSVDHARLVDTYRSSSAIAARAGKNIATTEELRTAMVHYRTLVDDLLQTETSMTERVLV
jgi:hypothetical protein